MLRAVTAALALLAVACGDDGGTVDAAPPDAAIDAEVPDAMVDRCVALCTCGTTNCPTQFPDMAACLTDCAGLEDSVKACRIEHCGYAQTFPSYHCPHAIGDATSPGVPPECLAN